MQTDVSIDIKTPRASGAERLYSYRASAWQIAVPVLAAAAVVLTTRHANPESVGELGLITVTPWTIFVIAAALSASFFWVLYSASRNGPALALHVFALALLLHGLPSLLEQEPRFTTAWLHAGFVSAIIEYKHPLTGLDARFSWPGFFTAAAALVKMAGLRSAVPLLRWTPLALNLAYTLPVYVIAKCLLRSRTRAWLVVWLFLLTNWVGQDYFSPQGAAYFLFMAILAVLVYAFSDPRTVPGSRLFGRWIDRLLDMRQTGVSDISVSRRTGLLLVVIVASLALTMAHQLTPVVLAIDVAALVIARCCSLRYLPAILVVFVLGWVSYGAVAFWSGHLGTFFEAGGSGAVSQNVAQRLRGSQSHVLVVYERVAFSLAVWLLAATGLLWAWRRGRQVSVVALILAVVPLPVLLAQSYGGEAQLRLYFYTFPFVLMLAVTGLPGDLAALTRRSAVALAIASPLIVPLLLIARFGNEQFEQVRPAEIAASEHLYGTAQKGSSLAAISANVVWRYRNFDSYQYEPDTLEDFELGTPKAILGVLGHNPKGSYLFVSTAQTVWAEVSDGLPKRWGAHVEALLAGKPQFKLIYSNRDARIYRVSASPGKKPVATRRPGG